MIGAAINLLVYIIVGLILYMLFDWLVKTVPIQDPIARILRILIVVVFVLVLVTLLLNFAGVPIGASLPRI